MTQQHRKRVAANPNSDSRRTRRPQPSLMSQVAKLWHPRARRQLRAAKLRATLIKVTADLLHSHELADLSIARIAHGAHCSVGAVYGHFPSKRMLVEAAVEKVFASELAQLAQTIGRASRAPRRSSKSIASEISSFAIQPFRPENAKIVRAAMRLSMHHATDTSAIQNLADRIHAIVGSALVQLLGAIGGKQEANSARTAVEAAILRAAVLPSAGSR